MDVYTLRAVLGLDDSEYNEKLNKSRDEAESQGKGIGGALGNALGTAAKVGVAAVGAASAATVAFGKKAIDAGMAFDTSMSQVYATMGDKANETIEYNGKVMASSEALRDYAQEMGATTAFSASEAADALNYMALAGYDAETSMSMLPNVLNLAAAGSIELGQASDMVTDAQSALGLSLEQTSDMVDQMAAASSNSNTSVSQLGEAFLTIGATARNLQGGTVELSTVLGVLADNGIKGAEGGTHLRNAILSLQTPTKEGAAALKELGMTYEDMYDSAGNMRSLPEIFQEMDAAMAGMNQQSKDAIISGIFNKTDLAAVNALIGTNAERWDELAGAIDNSAGAADKMAKVQLDNLGGDITLFKSALEGAQIAISDGLTPTLREFVQFGSEGLSRLTEAFREGGMTGAMNVFGDILSNGIAMITEMLPSVISAGTQVLTAFIQGMVNNIPQIAQAAADIITLLVTAFIQNAPLLLSGGLQLVIALATGIIQNAPQLISAATTLIMSLITGLVEGFPQLMSGGNDTVRALVDGIISAAGQVMNSARLILNYFLTIVKAQFPNILSHGVEMITNLVTGIIQMLPTVITTAGEIFNAFLNFIIENFPQILSAGINLIVNLVTGIMNTIPQVIAAALNVMLNLIQTILSKLPEILQAGVQLITQLIAGIDQMYTSVVDAALRTFGAVKDTIMDKIHEAIEWGKDLIGNFVDGIKSGISKVKEVVSDIGDTIADFIGFSEPEKGVLSNFHTYAPDMVDLFVKGIRDNAYKIPEAFNEALGLDNFAMPVEIDADEMGNRRNGVTVIQNIYSEAKTAAELMREAQWEQERAVLTGV